MYGFGHTIPKIKLKQGKSGFDTSYQAVIDFATLQGYTLPTEDQQLKQNQLFLDIKSMGVWDRFDLLYMFFTNGDRNFAKINVINPALFMCQERDSPIFVVNNGFAAQSPSLFGYLDTGFVMLTDAVKFKGQDASIGVYVSDDRGGGGTHYFCGDHIGTGGSIIRKGGSTTYIAGNQLGYPLSVDNSMHHLNINNVESAHFYNGVKVNTATNALANLSNQSMLIGSTQGTTNTNQHRIGLYFSGASLEDKALDFYNLIRDYKLSL